MGGCCQREPKDSKPLQSALHTEVDPTFAEQPPMLDLAETPLPSSTISATPKPFHRSATSAVVTRSKSRRVTERPRRMRSAPDAGVKLQTKKLGRAFSEIFEVKGEATRDVYGEISIVEHRKTGLVRLARIVEKTMQATAALSQEINTLQQLDHQSVLKPYEVLESDTHYYLLFEAIVGSRIVPHSELAGKQTETAAANIIVQLLQAIKHCHSKSVFLTNLAPRSVLFLETKTEGVLVKIVGLGAKRKTAAEKEISAEGFLAFCAPEAFRGVSSEKCDTWSCGALAYYLISGDLPFPASSKEDLRCELDHNALQFPLSVWGGYSLNLQRMLVEMMARSAEDRLSVAQCITHTWTRNYCFVDASDVVMSALKSLKKFKGGKKVKLQVINFLAMNVVPGGLRARLMKAFSAIDTNSENQVTPDELKSVYTHYYNERESTAIVTRVMEAVDLDRNGYLTSTEFVLAALGNKVLLAEASLQQSFEILDKDNSGSVHVTELMEALKCSEEDWRELLRKTDKDNDGEMNFEEYRALISCAME